MNIIAFENVSKIYNSHSAAVDGVSFAVEKGEFISLAGKSGAGKTTLLKLLIAEERPTKGRVLFNGQDVNKMPSRYLSVLRRKIGMVFQDYKLLSHKTAYENVGYAMEVAGMSDQDIRRDVPQVLDIVGLGDRWENFPSALSGGNLDPINTWEIVKLLIKINELGTTVVLATHNKEIVDSLERRVVILDGGKLIRDEQKGKYIIT